MTGDKAIGLDPAEDWDSTFFATSRSLQHSQGHKTLLDDESTIPERFKPFFIDSDLQ